MAAAAPLAVGPRTIAAQLEQIVSRGPVRPTGLSHPTNASRPASYVSHVGATRSATAARPAAPAATPAAAPAVAPAAAPIPELAEKPQPQKGIPPEIDRLNAAMRKSPIVLHVQRLVPLSKGSQMKRYEVLLRSGSEDAPNAAPHAMLKAAVENGLGSMIDRRVVTELIGWLVRHPSTWQTNEVMFSVNLTSTALHDEHFIKFIELCLAKSSLPKGTIAFEVDAPTAVTLADKISEVATALHRLGCPLVLDDFALRTECFELLRLPGVRYVKLAPEITAKMRTDKVSQAAITGVVQMARVLGMHTVAKHTESAAEQEWLTALGVDFVQSNAISPAAALDTLHKAAGVKV
jgi:EAL domain-containing protein (putative c-di-GMP-specific phosphodiesterase class I)